MRKSFILLTICALAGLWSCQSRIEDETPITYASDESEVEITVAADRTPLNVRQPLRTKTSSIIRIYCFSIPTESLYVGGRLSR